MSNFLQNRHLKPKIDFENNGKLKLQTCFSRNYDFAFTNLIKNVAEIVNSHNREWQDRDYRNCK